jgi:hypothetical protein
MGGRRLFAQALIVAGLPSAKRRVLYLLRDGTIREWAPDI